MDVHVKDGAGPSQWLSALKIRDFKLEEDCPKQIPPVVKRPLQGRRVMPDNLKWKSRRHFAPAHQLEWDLTYGVVPNARLYNVEHHHHAPGTDTLSLNVARPPVLEIHNTDVHQPHNANPKGPSTHHPVIANPTPGSPMAQTRGFEPSSPSNMQSYEHAHFVESSHINAFRPGDEGVRVAKIPRAPLSLGCQCQTQ